MKRKNVMFEPNFDPLYDLRMCQRQIAELQEAVSNLANAHNNLSKLVIQVTDQNTYMIEQLNHEKIMRLKETKRD